MLNAETLTAINNIILNLRKTDDIVDMCNDVLKSLNDIIPFKLGLIGISYSPNTKMRNKYTPIILSNYDKDFETQFLEGIAKHSKYDYMNWLLHSSKSVVYKDSELVNSELRESSPYYTEFLEKVGLIYASGIVIANNSQVTASLALYSDRETGDFTDDDIFILNYLCPHLEMAFDLYRNQIELNQSPASILHRELQLTDREIEIIGCIIEGCTNNEIADRLFVQTNTIKKHLYNIYIKLGVSSRTQLLRFIMKKGFLEYFIEADEAD